MPSLNEDVLTTSRRNGLKGRVRHKAKTTQENGAQSPLVSSVMRLQRLVGNAGVGQLLEAEEKQSPVKDLLATDTGQALDPQTRGLMESRFGEDFSDVRIHTGSKASQSAEAVNAQAYTVGSDIVFTGDKFQPNTPEGSRVLAHELTHVIQQRSGPVDGTPVGGGIKVSSPTDRFEKAAEETADRVVAGADVNATVSPATGVQREEQEVQTLDLQRQADEEAVVDEEEEEVDLEELA